MNDQEGRTRAAAQAQKLIDEALHDGPCEHPVIEAEDLVGPNGPIETIQRLTCGRVHFCFFASAELVRKLDRARVLLAGQTDGRIESILRLALECLLDGEDPGWRTRK